VYSTVWLIPFVYSTVWLIPFVYSTVWLIPFVYSTVWLIPFVYVLFYVFGICILYIAYINNRLFSLFCMYYHFKKSLKMLTG
jgi:hypothetical protein